MIKIEAVDKKTQTPLEGVKISVVNEKGKKIWKHVTLTALKEKVIPHPGIPFRSRKCQKASRNRKIKRLKLKAVANVQKYKVERGRKKHRCRQKNVWIPKNFDKTTGNHQLQDFHQIIHRIMKTL